MAARRPLPGNASHRPRAVVADSRYRRRMSTSAIKLIGPGGAGKSTVGDLIAKLLGIDFFDLDHCTGGVEPESIAERLATDGVRGLE